MQLVDSFFAQPIFVVTQLCSRTGIPKASAYSLLRQLENEGVILTLRAGLGNRSAMFVFPELLDLAEGRKIVRHRRNEK